MPYMDEPWFRLFAAEIAATSMQRTAQRLGVTTGCVCLVANGAGLYGTGAAGTAKFGRRVLMMLGRIECPFLSATTGEPREISGDQCRDYAYREVPTGSPLATRHWRACRDCERRVPPPRGWDEARRIWTDIKFIPRAPKARTAQGVAAPATHRKEAQT